MVATVTIGFVLFLDKVITYDMNKECGKVTLSDGVTMCLGTCDGDNCCQVDFDNNGET